MVRFLNTVSWAGIHFCRKPNEVIDLDEETAKARQKLGLGKIVADKSKKSPETVKVEPAPKAEAPKQKPEAAKPVAPSKAD